MDGAAWDRRYATGELLWDGAPNRFLEPEVGRLRPGRAIDLACGQGRNAIWLAERGWAVTGVDFSGAGLRRAQELASERGVSVEWVEADLRDYRLAPQAYDLVLMLYLQVGAGDRRLIVTSAARGVRDGGVFLLAGHHADNPKHGYGGPQNPDVLYTAEDILADLAGTGLQVEHAGCVRRPVSTPEGERVALDTLVRARGAVT